MSTSQVLLLLSPFFLLVTVFGAVVIVALCQAKEEDVPTILKESVAMFRRLADHLPHPRVISADPLQDGEGARDAVSGAPPKDVSVQTDDRQAEEQP
jgi:hypothetical protein